MTNTRSIVANTLSIVFVTSLFVLAFTWIIFDYTESSKSLKDAWDITGSFFGGITTLVAAYIATQLFNDWRDQHNKSVDSQFCMKIYDFIDFANLELVVISGFLRDYYTLDGYHKEKYKDELRLHARRLLNLKDTSMVKLSNIGYFIDQNEYELKYAPQILAIDENLEAYISIYHYYLLGAQYKGDIDEVPEKIDDLMINTRNRYRAFIVELAKYYKA